jgi:hypothetical protein
MSVVLTFLSKPPWCTRNKVISGLEFLFLALKMRVEDLKKTIGATRHFRCCSGMRRLAWKGFQSSNLAAALASYFGYLGSNASKLSSPSCQVAAQSTPLPRFAIAMVGDGATVRYRHLHVSGSLHHHLPSGRGKRVDD